MENPEEEELDTDDIPYSSPTAMPAPTPESDDERSTQKPDLKEGVAPISSLDCTADALLKASAACKGSKCST